MLRTLIRGMTASFAMVVPSLLFVAGAGAQNTSTHFLEVSRWDSFVNPVAFTNANADAAFSAATSVLTTDSDGLGGTGDASCNANLYRQGNVQLFYTSDGTISTSTEFGNVATATPGFVKVVKAVTWCGTMGAYAGCTGTGLLNHMVMAEGPSKGADRGVLWAHEFGHATGLSHVASPSTNIMYGSAGSSSVHVLAGQCPYFRSDSVDYNGASSLMAPSQLPSAFATTKEVESLDYRRPIEELARSRFHEVPVDVAEHHDVREVATLAAMLERAENASVEANIVQLVGLLSDGRDAHAELLVRYLKKRDSTAHARASAVLSLGYLAGKGSQVAFDHILSLTEDSTRMEADWAVTALALAGTEESLEAIRALPVSSARPVKGRPIYGRDRDLIDTAIAEHAKIFEAGLSTYYKH